MRNLSTVLVSLVLFAAACSPNKAPQTDSQVQIVDDSLADLDLLSPGSRSFSEFEYTSPAVKDNDVIPNAKAGSMTDVRGRIYLPDGQGPFPLVVFLHGNHGTCGIETGEGNPRIDASVAYTTTGKCPNGYIESPSYRGYDDAGRLLASYGFAVVSINANRGITGGNGPSSDSGLIYARGNLVLRHIEELAHLSRGDKASVISSPDLDLKGKLDLTRIGLMGHSRGGEGVRFAYNIYTDSSDSAKWQARIPGLKFKGIFEIAPVDMGAGSSKVEAHGVAWNVLIGGCDGDVSDFQGVNPYTRMLSSIDDGFPKSVFTVWGANHDFFNTQWQTSDAGHTCIGSQKPLWPTDLPELPEQYQELDSAARAGLTGSPIQIHIEEQLMLAFFRAHLADGKSLKLDHIFDPQYRLPSGLSSLAPNSREYFLATDTKAVLNTKSVASDVALQGDIAVQTMKDHVSGQISQMSEALNQYGLASGTNYKAFLTSSSYIRPALVIEGPGAQGGKAVSIPLSDVTSGAGYWTIDLSLANRKACYSFDKDFNLSCTPEALDDSFDVALELEDGTVTKAVNIRDYVTIDNWYSNYFEYSGTNNGVGVTNVYYSFVPVLYQTARFELTDFGVSSERIKGVRLSFKSGADISLILESIHLTKRPANQ